MPLSSWAHMTRVICVLIVLVAQVNAFSPKPTFVTRMRLFSTTPDKGPLQKAERTSKTSEEGQRLTGVGFVAAFKKVMKGSMRKRDFLRSRLALNLFNRRASTQTEHCRKPFDMFQTHQVLPHSEENQSHINVQFRRGMYY